MRSVKDSIDLKIAGFNIQVYFKRTFFHYEKKHIVQAIKSHYQGFILDKKPKKIDFRIDFISMRHYFILHKKEGRRFLYFYVEKRPKHIITFYYISLSQFNLIVLNAIELLLGKSGFIFHASAVNINGKAYIFTGKSGAGKSTIMKLLSEKYQPLADDVVIIKKVKEKFFFYQTHIIEKEDWIKKGLKSYPLDKIFFLRKTNFLKIEKIEKKTYIMSRIIKQLWTIRGNLDEQTKLLFNLTSYLDGFYFLYFPKNKKIIGDFKNLSSKI